MRSIEPEDRGSEINGGQKMTRCCVSAGGNSAILLEFAEEIFNQVSCPIKVFVIIARLFAVSFGWDDRCCSSLLEKIKNPFVSIISLVSEKGIGLKVWQKSIRAVQIVCLSGRQHEACWSAQRICRCVDFCAQSAPGSRPGQAFFASDGFVLSFFFLAPALGGCARTLQDVRNAKCGTRVLTCAGYAVDPGVCVIGVCGQVFEKILPYAVFSPATEPRVNGFPCAKSFR